MKPFTMKNQMIEDGAFTHYITTDIACHDGVNTATIFIQTTEECSFWLQRDNGLSYQETYTTRHGYTLSIEFITYQHLTDQLQAKSKATKESYLKQPLDYITERARQKHIALSTANRNKEENHKQPFQLWNLLFN